MLFSVRSVAALAAGMLVNSVSAQSRVTKYVPQGSSAEGVSYSANVPSSTAQNGNGPIYIQMVAPSGTQWLGLGQGRGMAGANMFVMYASGSNNVTLSPRLGRGEFEPEVNSAAQITLLEGSGISPNGVMTANIRCDSCISWDGGSMSPRSGNSHWIWSIKQGNALNSADIAADIRRHDAHGAFTFDLPAGTSSDSANPFVQAALVTQSAGSSQPTSTGGDHESSGGSSSEALKGSTGGASNNDLIRRSHGIIMAVVFLFLFPAGALLIYVPFSRRIVLAHAPFQVVSVCLLIVGISLGVMLGVSIDEYNGYHQIIGYFIVNCLLLFQPALGVVQHLKYRKFGKRTVFGHIHRWHGRMLIVLGIINGGLGLHVSGEIGSEVVPTWSVVAYSVIAAVVGLFYIGLLSGHEISHKREAGSKEDTKNGNDNDKSSGDMSVPAS